MSKALTTMAMMAATLGATLPMPNGKAPRVRGPRTPSDERDLAAAQAKRDRKNAKRLAELPNGEPNTVST